MILRLIEKHWDIAWSDEVRRHVESKVSKWGISTEAITACLLERRTEWKRSKPPEPGHILEWLTALRVQTRTEPKHIEDSDVLVEIEREARWMRQRRLEAQFGVDSEDERRVVGEWIARECYYRSLPDSIAFRLAASIDQRLADGVASWHEGRDNTLESWAKRGKHPRILKQAGLSGIVE